MVRWEQNRYRLRTSVLDKLVDESPGSAREPDQDRMLSVAQVKMSVLQDIENLLNTRRGILQPASGYPELSNSVYSYGIADFTAADPKNKSVRQQLRRDIEKTLSRFEPRLRNVRVHLEMRGKNLRQLRFHVTALLVIEPIREPVSFDTLFDLNRSECIVSG